MHFVNINEDQNQEEGFGRRLIDGLRYSSSGFVILLRSSQTGPSLAHNQTEQFLGAAECRKGGGIF